MIHIAKSQQYQTILIVDDTPQNLQLLVKYLEDAGYKIFIAQTGANAIRTAEACHPSLILLDVMMAEIDGFSVCKHLKNSSLTQHIPVIFMTALVETKHKVQGFKLGAVDYITKPINRDELLARIKTHLSLQSFNQHLAQEAGRQKLLLEISDRIRQCLNLKSVMDTAVKEIGTFLDCESVWLTRLEDRDIVLETSTSVITAESKQPLTWNYICTSEEESWFYRQGNIKVVDPADPEQLLDRPLWLNRSIQIILPLLVGSNRVDACVNISGDAALTPEDFQNNSSALWGWLIIDYHNCTQYQINEIKLLKVLTNQLAIAIDRGMLYQKLCQQAQIDSLTKIYNRRYVDAQLLLEWRRLQRTSSHLALILCDVDYFKLYNDTYGHQLGDECLRKIAQAISKTIKRPADVVARYGGEEFIIVLPQTPQSGAIKVAESIKTAVRQLEIPHLNSHADSVVTISIGVANTIPNSEDNPQLLIEAADLALYKAKERGRNGIAVYPRPISHSRNQHDLETSWVKRIRHALENNLFSLYAQPISPLGNDSKQYFEVLLRLTDEKEQVITPSLFLDIAERNCMMPDIDIWVINTLLEQLANRGNLEKISPQKSDWQNHRFSVNLSGASLNSEAFLEFLLQKLADYHLPSELFCFEITETVAVSDLDKVSKFIKALKNLGCSFALDDFGKGMSSLTYLKNLPIDYLKIDGSFIRELNHNQAAKVMVEAINHIAAGMGLKTVAEFVENQAILDTIIDLKVDYAQGFYLGRPDVLMDVIS